MAGENWTFWLNMTNFALGMITVLAMAVVFVAVGWDLIALKMRKRPDVENIASELHAMFHGSPHSLSVPGLGLTMADGGEQVEPSESEATDKKLRK